MALTRDALECRTDAVHDQLFGQVHNPDAGVGEIRVAIAIARLATRSSMTRTVDLDSESQLRAVEVDDERTDLVLPPELEPVETPISQA